jgi:NTP pyrophosphatase (non-canonical NTP hydrolase)
MRFRSCGTNFGSSLEAVGLEAADILLYLIRFANKLDLDL